MQTTSFPVYGINAIHFTEALAQNVASAMYNLTGPPWASRWALVRAILVITSENFGPEFNFFAKAAGFTTNVETDLFLGRFAFTSGMGEQIGASGLWRYYNDGMAIPYIDRDNQLSTSPAQIHVKLQNVSATAKLATAGAAGNIHVTIWIEPMIAIQS